MDRLKISGPRYGSSHSFFKKKKMLHSNTPLHSNTIFPKKCQSAFGGQRSL